MKLHTATISFHRRPLSRKYYGEVRINGDCVYVTENFAYKESAINALKKESRSLTAYTATDWRSQSHLQKMVQSSVDTRQKETGITLVTDLPQKNIKSA